MSCFTLDMYWRRQLYGTFNRNSVFFSIILIINQVFGSLLLPIPAKLDKSLDVHITYR